MDNDGQPKVINPYATWTECIGYESMSEDSKCGELTVYDDLPSRTTSRETALRMKGKNVEVTRDIPPILPSLRKKGHWRFNLVKLRENGRLRIEMLPTEDPQEQKN